MIEFKSISKMYSNNIIGLKDVSFHVKKGEFVFITGPSGAGKSTIIKLLLKEIDPDSGRILFEGEDITKVKRSHIPSVRKRIGVVFQDFRLLKDRTVYENIEFVLDVHGYTKKEKKKIIEDVLTLVKLEDRQKSYPRELSGGEQQRVSIARALAINPSLIVADEPTGNLDPETAWEIIGFFKEVNQRGTTVLINTHSKEIVDRMEKRVIALENGVIIRDSIGGYHHENI